jgi:hypothetical protein
MGLQPRASQGLELGVEAEVLEKMALEVAEEVVVVLGKMALVLGRTKKEPQPLEIRSVWT